LPLLKFQPPYIDDVNVATYLEGDQTILMRCNRS